MTDPVTIVLLGAPVGKGRHRTTKTGHPPYTPAKTRVVENTLASAAQVAMNGRMPLEGALSLVMLAECPIPKSWSKTKQLDALGRFVTTRPDLDNVLKLAKDAMNTVVYHDDSQVAQVRMEKYYGTQPKLVVTVSPLCRV
jgi:Holliday junction resolvase RusA-like endonuclease